MDFIAIPGWIWIFLVTVVVAGLVRYAWFGQDKRIQALEDCKLDLNKKGGPLTFFGHQEMCGRFAKERDEEMTESVSNLKEWLGWGLDGMQKDIKNLSENVEDKIENKVLRELRKLNGSN
ncbi:MAG: hypothetical protein IMZ43_09690 [Thermoplasmata archaeon]|nr:hypothetical protein [Thermoplasmata archaeon]